MDWTGPYGKGGPKFKEVIPQVAREANGFPRLSKLSESAEPNLHCGFRLHSLDCDGLEFDLIRLHCG